MSDQPWPVPDDFDRFERLIAVWRDYTENHPEPDGFSRNAGFNSALRICADQLAGEIKAARDE